MTKVCSICNYEKDITFFGKRKRSKDGHRSECKDCRKIYYENNKSSIKQYKIDYYELNKIDIKNHNKNYLTNKRKNDPIFRYMGNVSRQIVSALNKQKSSKNGKSCWTKLPYSIEEMILHLEKQFEPWMNWNNYGRYNIKTWDDNDQSTWTWQIDHIIPQSKLPYVLMTDDNFQKCWALNNLRPYSAKQNIIDGNRKIIF